jgi:endonuclease YncB( thermonuclease family)
LPLHRPRRIFRSGSYSSGRRRDWRARPTVIAGLIGAVGGAALMLFSSPAALFGRVPRLAGQLDADAPLVAVVDGQTLRLRESVIRLHGVVAPTRGQECSGSDGTRFDCGAAASEALAALVRGHAVACRLDGRDSAGFPQGNCEAAGVSLNRAVVASGWARADSHASDLAAEEASARAQHLGIWRAGEAAATF